MSQMKSMKSYASKIEDRELISIIVPCYNVEDDVDCCVESLVNQTYDNIEILLINDGSTDGTLKKLMNWKNKDSRICVTDKLNEGLGPTRNRGVQECTGDYVMYVDSDDWVDITIVEKLYESLKKNNADISVCGRIEVEKITGVANEIKNEVEAERVKPSEHRDIIWKTLASAYGKLYRKSLIVDNAVWQPNHIYEDVVTYVLLALADVVSYVNECLYFYQIDRSRSITNQLGSLEGMKESIHTIMNEYKSRGLFELYKAELQIYFRKRIYWSFKRADTVINAYHEQFSDYMKEFYLQNFGKDLETKSCFWKNGQICVIGSYNLMLTGKILTACEHDESLMHYYGFSSLVSIMAPYNSDLNKYPVYHKNPYRQRQLINDFSKKLQYRNPAELGEVKAVILDFLEERFDVGVYDNTYFTVSDAFMDIDEERDMSYRLITHGSKKFISLWKECCLAFIHMIREYFRFPCVILVKMKLSRMYGNDEEKHIYKEIIEEIDRINAGLELYYQFFEQNCPEALVVDVEQDDLYYTGENYRHGRYPWHLNEEMYKKISNMVEAKISGEEY